MMIKQTAAFLCLLLLPQTSLQAQVQTDTTSELSVPLRMTLNTAKSLAFTAKLTYGSYGEVGRTLGQTFLVKARKPG